MSLDHELKIMCPNENRAHANDSELLVTGVADRVAGRVGVAVEGVVLVAKLGKQAE